jgi:hypothetical protein
MALEAESCMAGFLARRSKHQFFFHTIIYLLISFHFISFHTRVLLHSGFLFL